MQRWVVICCCALLAVVFADECPDGGKCENGQTCCKHPSNGYECCPFDQAECCEDHAHCCPAGMTCDVSKSSCVNTTASVPWAERSSVEQPRVSKSFRMIKTYIGEDDDNICPDQSRCPAEFSCLRALTKYGCCPLAQGIPCSDGKHCCPEGHSCSEDSRSCIKKDLVTTVLCSDGESECPEESSCCESADGQFGCCPMPQAVCCEDKTHCCPEGSSCDVENSKCISSSSQKELPMWAKFPARKRADWENQKESQHVTAETATDTNSEKALGEEPVGPYSEEKESLSVTTETPKNVAKPGGLVCNVTCDPSHACPDGTTCCSDGQGGWGCCPYPNAVCCKDHRHCCPNGMTCDFAHVRCVSGSEFTTMSQKTPALITAAPASTTDSQTTEPTQTEEEREKDDELEDDEEDEEDEEDDQDKVHCNHHTHCPKNSTCCRSGRHRWGCCPVPHAVCCSDGKHCCPHHHNCSDSQRACVRDDVVIPWYTKLPAKSSPEAQVLKNVAKPSESASNVSCDQTESCPDGTTCCSDGEGGWGCCPYPNAVCCSDHRSCCPSGTTCDLAHQSCLEASDSTPMSQKTSTLTTTAPASTTESQNIEPAQSEESEEEEEEEEEDEEDEEDEDLVHCDRSTSCPKDTTCCRMGHQWGCCPLQHAVCCTDGKHCCPHRHKCSPSRQACVRDDAVIPWYTKLPAISSLETHSETDNVRCSDSKRCPPYNTCCLLSSGQYGCCPMENAVCCSDKTHCCPQDYTCDITSQVCERAVLLEVDLVPLTPVSQPKTERVEQTFVQCDAKTVCPDGFKCCEITTAVWHCCPYINGVCCSGFNQCCPYGQRCTGTGTCTWKSWSPWDNWPVFGREEKKPQIV